MSSYCNGTSGRIDLMIFIGITIATAAQQWWIDGRFTTKPANVFLVHGWDLTRYLELLECYLMQLVMVVFSYSIVKVAGVAQEDSSTNKRPSCYYFKRI
uniref:Uncharacterized protein n=1 Tax=Amphimedon queenslandica TaxID=400682 RepID=A0A1X7SI60_AMPQE